MTDRPKLDIETVGALTASLPVSAEDERTIDGLMAKREVVVRPTTARLSWREETRLAWHEPSRRGPRIFIAIGGGVEHSLDYETARRLDTELGRAVFECAKSLSAASPPVGVGSPLEGGESAGTQPSRLRPDDPIGPGTFIDHSREPSDPDILSPSADQGEPTEIDLQMMALIHDGGWRAVYDAGVASQAARVAHAGSNFLAKCESIRDELADAGVELRASDYLAEIAADRTDEPSAAYLAALKRQLDWQRRVLAEKDARIAELTTQRDSALERAKAVDLLNDERAAAIKGLLHACQIGEFPHRSGGYSQATWDAIEEALVAGRKALGEES